jgi:hypothetical protein
MAAGFKHRGAHYVLDNESLRTNSKGCGRPIQVYQSELVGQIPRDVADPFKSIKVNWWIQMMGIGFFRCMKRK